MVRVHSDKDSRQGQPSVVAVGRFDGVHLGHQAVLRQLAEAADRLRARRAVVVLEPNQADRAVRISTLDHTLELLHDWGVDTTVVLRDGDGDDTHARNDARNDARNGAVLPGILDTLHAALVLAGDDRGETTASCPVRRVAPVTAATASGRPEPVTCERIVSLLLRGEVDQATALLGRPFEVRGEVSHGDARGRTLGFPTANIPIPSELALPGDGVYAGHYVRPNGERFATAISLGRRPTFYELRGDRLLEAHLLDFDGDLYGEPGTVTFERRLRRQRKFDSVDTLVAQLHQDVAQTRAVLSRLPGPPARRRGTDHEDEAQTEGSAAGR